MGVRDGMSRRKISNARWIELELLLPVVEPSSKGGRPRTDDRAALNGILFVLHTGILREDLLQAPGFGSGMTCWRQLRDWQFDGLRERLHLARRLREHNQIDWSRASIDGASVSSPQCRADEEYDFARCRQYLHKRSIITRIARRGVGKNDRPGKH